MTNFSAAPRGAGQAALARGQGPAGAHPAGEQGAHGEAGGLLDGGPEPVSGGGRAPQGDPGPVPGAGAQVQQGQAAHQGLPAEVRRAPRPNVCLSGLKILTKRGGTFRPAYPAQRSLFLVPFPQGDRVPEEGNPAVRTGRGGGLGSPGGVRAAGGAGKRIAAAAAAVRSLCGLSLIAARSHWEEPDLISGSGATRQAAGCSDPFVLMQR